MTREIPTAHNDEIALLGACLTSDLAYELASPIVEATDFHPPKHQNIWAAIETVATSGDRVDVLTVHAACPDPTVTLELLHELQNGVWSTTNAASYAERIISARLRRQLIHQAAEITRLGYGETGSVDAADACERARDLLADLDMPVGRGAPDPDIDTFVNSTATDYDWLIPDFLERRDRCLITASEGAGKSVLLAQIAVQAAAGVHPWTWERTTPRNVLVVDLENQPRLVARRFAKLRQKAGPDLDPQRIRVHTRPEGLDLSSRRDRRWLIDRCQANNAELLVIGPAYRMTSGVAECGDIGGEDHARQATKVLDDIRYRCDVAMLMETHAPHGHGGGRDLRPFGSSVWLRWPEFGIGLRRQSDDEYRVEHWRGPRDVRIWPTTLTRHGHWMWNPTMPTGFYRQPDTPADLFDDTAPTQEQF